MGRLAATRGIRGDLRRCCGSAVVPQVRLRCVREGKIMKYLKIFCEGRWVCNVFADSVTEGHGLKYAYRGDKIVAGISSSATVQSVDTDPEPHQTETRV